VRIPTTTSVPVQPVGAGVGDAVVGTGVGCAVGGSVGGGVIGGGVGLVTQADPNVCVSEDPNWPPLFTSTPSYLIV